MDHEKRKEPVKIPQIQHNSDKCYYYEKLGHVKVEFPKCKTMFKKKDKPFVFICFVNVPTNS